MKNKDTIYNIVVHTVNLILLGAIGLFAFFSVLNISPNQNTTSDMVAFVSVVFLTAMWAINYWFQIKQRKMDTTNSWNCPVRRHRYFLPGCRHPNILRRFYKISPQPYRIKK
jgi:protein-S-isoprenylcysteine O-methyltransferase Ste14